jgi:carbon monoxide dehydrogenase subunit G
MNMAFETEIRTSPKRLWPWLTEPELMKQWMSGLQGFEMTSPGPLRAGSTAKLLIKEGGRVQTWDETILDWEPQRRVRISMTGAHCPGLEMVCDNRLEDLGGSTRLHYAFECRTSRAFFKVMGFLFGFFAKLQAKGFMKRLKRLAEADGAVTAS